MKRIMTYFLILAVLFTVPVGARSFNQPQNEFKGIQLFESTLVLDALQDSVSINTVSDDTLMRGMRHNALTTEYAVGKYVSSRSSLAYFDSLRIISQGYMTYSVKVVQTGTAVPSLTLIHSDFGKVDPENLSVRRDAAGEYALSITSFFENDTVSTAISKYGGLKEPEYYIADVSNSNPGEYGSYPSVNGTVSATIKTGGLGGFEVYIWSYDNTGTLADGVLDENSGVMITIILPLSAYY